jgi:hypothetical protein
MDTPKPVSKCFFNFSQEIPGTRNSKQPLWMALVAPLSFKTAVSIALQSTHLPAIAEFSTY